MTFSPLDAPARRATNLSTVSRTGRLAVVAAATLVVAQSASAIVWRNDMTEAVSAGLARQNQFSGTGDVFGASGNLILQDWVLTAKHVVGSNPNATFRLNGVTYSGVTYTDPNSDTALIRLTGALPSLSAVSPIPINTTGGEVGKMSWIVGYGGHGNVSQSANGGANLTYNGTVHAGTNVVREYADPFLFFNNANTDATATVYESSTAPGDSGGPMYQQINNQWFVVGEVFGAGAQGFIHSPTNRNKNFILNTIRTAKGDPTFNFTAAAAPTSLTWDSDVTTDGLNDGSGTWDVQRTNFYAAATGFNYQWENARANDVVFGSNQAAAGTVNIVATNLASGTKNDGTAGPTITAPGVTAHNLTFNAAASGNYTLAGNGLLTLATSAFSAGDPVITTNANAAISAPVGGSTATITKAGTGTLTLSGFNGYTGKMQVNTGTLAVTRDEALPGYNAPNRVSVANGARLLVNVDGVDPAFTTQWVDGQVAQLAAAGTFAVGSTFAIDTTGGGVNPVSINQGGVLPVNATFEKLGARQLNLTSAQTYTGGTKISAGTLGVVSNGRLPTNTVVGFANGTALAINAGINQTVAGLVAADNGTATVNGPGTLTLAAAAPALGGLGTTIDMTAVGGFVFNTPAQALNVNGNNTFVKLAGGTLGNTINATALNVGTGDFGAVTDTTTTLQLGKTNTIGVNTLNVGSRHADGHLAFAPGQTGATATLNGAAGSTSRIANVVVGYNNAGVQSQTSSLDFSGGTVTLALVDNLVLADYVVGDGTATTTASMNLAAGRIDSNNLILARSASGANRGGTTHATVNHTGGVLLASTLTLATAGTAQAATNQTAIYNLNGAGAELRATTITGGTLSAATTAARTINFNNGQIRTYINGTAGTNLEIKGSSSTSANGVLRINLANTGTHTFHADTGRTITVRPTAVLQNFVGASGGTLTKTGSGTMRIESANTYNGATVISAGAMIVNGSLGNTAVTVALNSSFGGRGAVGGSVTSSGTLMPGDAGPGTLTLGGLTLSNGSKLSFNLASAVSGRDLINTTSLALGQNVALAIAGGTGFGVGTYSLIDYTGAPANAANLSSWTATGVPAEMTYLFALGSNAATSRTSVNLIVSPVAAPEPAAVAFFGIVAGTALLRRRRAAVVH